MYASSTTTTGCTPSAAPATSAVRAVRATHVDAFTSAKNYDKYLAQEANRFSNPVSLEEKAEGKYLAVAVSSIIARDLFLENLENLGRELGYQLPSGAGTASDKVASQILQAYGMQGLNFCAKLHFKNTEKAKKC